MAAPNKWTIMFYFASDHPLAPSIVSQLKAMTNAGFHQGVQVVCRFDPHTVGTDTHVFDVNLISKLRQQKGNRNRRVKNRYKFWGPNDPYVRNLAFDKLWNDDKVFSDNRRIRAEIKEVLRRDFRISNYNPPQPGTIKLPGKVNGKSVEPGPKESLEAFLRFCARHYKAENYMLFILGHGLVVGNDMFLYDENASVSSLSLTDLGVVLKRFATRTPGGKKIDLLGFHSCSMSSVEVAYQLRDSADYMLASQGPAFVGSWPYREILIRVFNDVIKTESLEAAKGKKRRGKPPSIRSTIEKIFEYVLRYSYDFQLAGYSFDLALCDLNEIGQITAPLKKLSRSLTKSLTSKSNSDALVKEAVLLAHWDAQSFWQESYTDLYDFCSCLKRRCNHFAGLIGDSASQLGDISEQCKDVISVLENDIKKGGSLLRKKAGGSGPIVRAAFAGPQYQYSHGLSVYFPWAEPVNEYFWQSSDSEYKKKYKFKQTLWAEFLSAYFTETQRRPVHMEIKDEFGLSAVHKPTAVEKILEEITSKVYNPRGPLSTLAGPGKGGPGQPLGPGDGKGGPGQGLDGEEKPGPGAGMGGSCDCPAIKNYPSFTFERPGRRYDDENERPRLASDSLYPCLLNERR